ncbi:SMI1/KNR4 family protein [Streptomyces sp. NPDC044571]|uniref:SMI1/KNR4 family protein n=1 Tax=Streptomyces sp. NPDC044571 TaxID=3155371 RepID=UPI0033FD8F91
MTPADDRRFPAPLAAALTAPFDYENGDGIDFEPFDSFLSAAETADWFQAWTGNTELTGEEFRVFGQDGTGGYAAFWLLRPDRPLSGQPVVFLGSEGETGVVARDLGDFLWLLADGFGPLEAATTYAPDRLPRPDAARTAIAERHAPDRRKPAKTVIELAGREFPGFDETVMAFCR